MDLNPSQPLVSTPVDTGMHKEDQHATCGPTSLGVTSEVRANPQLSSGMSAFNLNEPIYSASFIIYSESTSGNDALAVSTAEVDPGKSALSDFVPQQQGGKTRGFDQITNKDAIVLYSLANGIKIDYASTKPGAKPGHKKHSTSSKQPSVSSKEATKGRSSKAPTSSKTGHSKKRKEFSSAMDSNPSPPLVSTPVDTRMHKEYQQATGGPTSLRVASETRANPQLNSGKSAFNLNEHIYSASFIIHSESALGNDASAFSIAEADPGKSAPSDFIPQQQGMNEGTKNTLYDHLFAGTDPHVLVDKTQSVIEGLETGKYSSLEDLAKLVSRVQPSFKDLDSPEDDPIIVVDDSDEDKEADEVHATTNVKTEDTSVPKSSSPSLLPTKLKDLPSKFNELNKEVKGLKQQVHELEIELLGDLKEIPSKLEDFTKAKLKALDALPSLLNKVTNALNRFAQAIASKTTRDTSVPSAGQAGTKPAEGEKNTNQATISHDSDDETHVAGSMVETSRIKKLKKFDFITEDGKHIHLTEEQSNQQKKIEEEAKAEAVKQEGEVRKEELVDLLSAEVVNKYYNDKLQYDRYCDKMLNRRAESRITNCDVLTKKGPNTLKVYREDDTSEVIPNFKANKRLKSPVQYEDHLPGTVLNEPVLGMIMFNSYHRQDFVTVEDLEVFSNAMLYIYKKSSSDVIKVLGRMIMPGPSAPFCLL
ncbi:hypothetical protein Tco_0139144 [Tanacetum coccineum]